MRPTHPHLPVRRVFTPCPSGCQCERCTVRPALDLRDPVDYEDAIKCRRPFGEGPPTLTHNPFAALSAKTGHK